MELKFGYIDLHGAQKDVFRFKPDYLAGEDKFVQLEINGEDYVRVGNLYHRRILRETLVEFGLEFDETKSRSGYMMPLSEGKDYKLVGAGKINLFENNLKFWDTSSDYFKFIKGVNVEGLENIFGKDNVSVSGKTSFGPIVLVQNR